MKVKGISNIKKSEYKFKQAKLCHLRELKCEQEPNPFDCKCVWW